MSGPDIVLDLRAAAPTLPPRKLVELIRQAALEIERLRVRAEKAKSR
mgnify:CR=1 FL=1